MHNYNNTMPKWFFQQFWPSFPISYHCTNYRSWKHEIGIMWNDENIKIKWPIKKPILSKKDKKNLSLKDYIKSYG